MHHSMLKKKTKYIFLGAMAFLLTVQLAVMFCYGSQKSGFHEDELYTYYSTNKTAGLFVNDRQWVEQDQIKNEFAVLWGERFRYGVVKQMQSWDVHPPLYYYIFHTVCSLFPGSFSKWTGIGVNLAAYVISFILLGYIAWIVSEDSLKDGKEKKKERQSMCLAFITCAIWGFGAAVISGVMFIRMYEWLTVFVLLIAALHIRAVIRQNFCLGQFLLPVGITVFLGFLTQYYYIIFHFFLGAGICLYFLFQKRIRTLLSYGAVCAACLFGALLYYPAALSHIFRGYRGTEAVNEFSDLSNTWERLRFFFGLFNDYMLNGTLIWWLVLLALLGVMVLCRKRKRIFTTPALLLLFAAAGYFFTVSKTALLLGETSNRYQLPLYGIWIFLLCYVFWRLIRELTGVYTVPAVLLLGGILLLVDVTALADGRVFFLYREEKPVMEFVRENAHKYPAAVFYNEASPDKIWWLSDELMEYPGVFLASLGNNEPVADSILNSCDGLLLYVADYGEQEENPETLSDEAETLLSCNKKLDESLLIARKGMWSLYFLWDSSSGSNISLPEPERFRQ